MRDIPAHKDDNVSPSKVAPIEKDDAQLYGRLSIIDWKLGGKLTFEDKCTFSFGAGTDFTFDATPHIRYAKLGGGGWFLDTGGKRHDIRERNYTNQPGTEERGRGAALTYFYVHPKYWVDWNTTLRPYLFSKLEIGTEKDRTLSIGYNLYRETLVLEDGWDRYASREILQKDDIADMLVGEAFISLVLSVNKPDPYKDELGFLELHVGAAHIVSKSISELGEKTDIDFNQPALVVGVNYTIHFN